jgi:hypothetical protein
MPVVALEALRFGVPAEDGDQRDRHLVGDADGGEGYEPQPRAAVGEDQQQGHDDDRGEQQT